MTTFKLLAATTIFSALIMASASAEPVIDEPGMYAFYHPTSNLGMGSSGTVTDARAMIPQAPRRMPAPHHARTAK